MIESPPFDTFCTSLDSSYSFLMRLLTILTLKTPDSTSVNRFQRDAINLHDTFNVFITGLDTKGRINLIVHLIYISLLSTLGRLRHIVSFNFLFFKSAFGRKLMAINLLPHYYGRWEVLLCWHLSARPINVLSVRPNYICYRKQRSLHRTLTPFTNSKIISLQKYFGSYVLLLLNIINYSRDRYT